MITTAQATQYLDQMLGVGAPAFLVAAAVETVEGAEPAMQAAGYTEAAMVGIQCMAVALIVAAGNPRRISSQAAASGASRSFKYSDEDLSRMRRSLMSLDTAGTVSALVGPDPAGAAFLMVV
jgi:hypothetical protein